MVMKRLLFRASTVFLFSIIVFGCNQSLEKKSAPLEGTVDSLKQTCDSLNLKLLQQESSINELSIKVEKMASLNTPKITPKNLSKKSHGKRHKMR
jgi:hypothetical protein